MSGTWNIRRILELLKEDYEKHSGLEYTEIYDRIQKEFEFEYVSYYHKHMEGLARLGLIRIFTHPEVTVGPIGYMITRAGIEKLKEINESPDPNTGLWSKEPPGYRKDGWVDYFDKKQKTCIELEKY